MRTIETSAEANIPVDGRGNPFIEPQMRKRQRPAALHDAAATFPRASEPPSDSAPAGKSLVRISGIANSCGISIMRSPLNVLPTLIRGFRFLGWVLLIFGTLMLIHFVRALNDPAATVNFNHVETSDPDTKLRATLSAALFPIVGLFLVSCPRRIFERLYVRAKAEREKVLGPHRKR